MVAILLVDDDDDLSGSLKDLFEMQDHSVKLAQDGASALKSMTDGQFDLILLDWQLPDMPGVEVCQKYRHAGGKSPVLMLTGMRDTQSKEIGTTAGANGFLIKPFTVKQLLESVRNLIG